MKTLLIDIDSLRPDHVSAYGYEKPTTPHIDALAADGVLFENAFVANSPCLPSRAALLSGRYGTSTGIVTHGPESQQLSFPATDKTNPWAGSWHDRVDQPVDWYTLPELAFQERIHTGAVSSFPRHPAPWFHRTWHEFSVPQEPAGPSENFQTVRGASVADKAETFLGDHTDTDTLLYLQFWDPHAPYNRSADEVEQFRSGFPHPYPTDDQIRDHQTWDQWRSAAHMEVADRADLVDLVAGYDAEIRYVDEQVGRVLNRLRTEEIYEETLVIFTADHGEEFGEHGLYREHWSTHEGTQRVPLIIKPPASAPIDRGVRSQLVTNLDIAPTVADYADLPVPGRWQGDSLLPIVEEGKASDRDHVVLEHGLYTAQRAIRTHRWKYVRTHHPGMWTETVPEEQLFDVLDDPWEQVDRSEENPNVRDRLRTTLSEWLRDKTTAEKDPLAALTDRGPAGSRWARAKLADSS